jgi:sulfate adenylyltransferase
MDRQESSQELIMPHGGALKQLYLSSEDASAEQAAARDFVSWDLTPRQICDIELLLNGAFSPLEGFLGKADYDGVVENMRLADGTLWPMPITLDVSQAFADGLEVGQRIALRDVEGVLIATMDVEDIWTPDKAAEALGVYGSEDEAHPGVHYLKNLANPVYVGGRVHGVEAPIHYDFKYLRDTPAELRARFAKLGWRKIVAFQTRNPMHRAHQELTFRAAKDVEANLLMSSA